MKETINVNIAGQAFTMDMDAYKSLTSYLGEISRRLPETDSETLADIEARIAEIFREKVPSPIMVITYGSVQSVIQQIGAPEAFGSAEREANTQDENKAEKQTPTSAKPRLYRSRSCRTIGGVCGGIADYLNVDVSMVRIVAILLIFFAGGSLCLYVIMWIVVPEEPVAQVTTGTSPNNIE